MNMPPTQLDIVRLNCRVSKVWLLHFNHISIKIKVNQNLSEFCQVPFCDVVQLTVDQLIEILD